MESPGLWRLRHFRPEGGAGIFVQRPGCTLIGIHGVTVTEELTAGQGIPSGVYVQEVSTDSPAMAAGIQSGDVITEVAGTQVTTLSGYNSALMQQEAGDEIRVKGQRQGTGGYVDITFRVTVGSRE